MRHLMKMIVAIPVALAAEPVAVAQPASAQEYPVVEEFQGLNLMEHFINGAAPIGDTDLERNCRPSGEARDALFMLNLGGQRVISPNLLFREGERQGIINRYFQCIGLERFSEPEMFGCSSIKTLFRYLEMFQPNHPSPDRARWNEMDQELYFGLYLVGRVVIRRDLDGSMRTVHGNRWTICKELWG